MFTWVVLSRSRTARGPLEGQSYQDQNVTAVTSCDTCRKRTKRDSETFWKPKLSEVTQHHSSTLLVAHVERCFRTVYVPRITGQTHKARSDTKYIPNKALGAACGKTNHHPGGPEYNVRLGSDMSMKRPLYSRPCLLYTSPSPRD